LALGLREAVVRTFWVTFCAGAVFALALGGPVAAQSAPASGSAATSTPASSGQEELLKNAEAYLRNLYAWGPDFKVKLGPMAPSLAADFYKVPVQVTLNGQSDTGEVYVSKDGKTIMRGDMFDMQKDPYADARGKLHVDGAPTMGPANAPVTVVEFADFECPHCKEFNDMLGPILQKWPQVKFVYKDFPLVDIHPWAETASVGARCAAVQSPAAFWKMHDAIFAQQDVISTENVWDKLNGFATDEGLNVDAFKACMASEDAKKFVETERAEGAELGVNSTPTIYVNGRPVVGGDTNLTQQFIQYELNSKTK
jgi:protein-disulfide isomerase